MQWFEDLQILLYEMHKNVYDFLFFLLNVMITLHLNAKPLKPSCYLITIKTVFCDEHYYILKTIWTVVRLYKIDTTKKANRMSVIISYNL